AEDDIRVPPRSGLEDRAEGPTWPTPLCPKIHEHGALFHGIGKGGGLECNGRHGLSSTVRLRQKWARMVSSMKVRTTFSLVILLGVAGTGGYFYWQSIEKDRTIADQKRVIGELGVKLDRAFAAELLGDLRIDAVADKADPPTIDATFYQYAAGTE